MAANTLRKTRSPTAVETPGALVFRVFVEGRPISVNSMYTAGRGINRYGGRRRTPEAIAWTMAVWAHCFRYRPSRSQPLRLPLKIEIALYRIRANADPNNYTKCVCDGVRDALGIDDKHFDDVRIRRVSLPKGTTSGYPQGAEITVWQSPE